MDKKKVLVVDDDSTIGEMLKTGLEAMGYAVDIAANSTQVWAAIEKSKPQIILMDVGVPGLDGISMCRNIRFSPELSAIPIIIMTAFSDQKTYHDAMFFGANDFLAKPFDIAEMKQKIESALMHKKKQKEGNQ